jgi:hypothetical protein
MQHAIAVAQTAGAEESAVVPMRASLDHLI